MACRQKRLSRLKKVFSKHYLCAETVLLDVVGVVLDGDASLPLIFT